MLSKWHVTRIESGKLVKCLQNISFEGLRSKDSFKNYVSKCYQNGMNWNRIKKVVKCLQKCIIRIAKKQEQFQKLYHKMLSQWHMTGIESGKVGKCLQKYIIQRAKKQG